MGLGYDCVDEDMTGVSDSDAWQFARAAKESRSARAGELGLDDIDRREQVHLSLCFESRAPRPFSSIKGIFIVVETLSQQIVLLVGLLRREQGELEHFRCSMTADRALSRRDRSPYPRRIPLFLPLSLLP
jgi:hypothetical protein